MRLHICRTFTLRFSVSAFGSTYSQFIYFKILMNLVDSLGNCWYWRDDYKASNSEIWIKKFDFILYPGSRVSDLPSWCPLSIQKGP